MLTNEHKKDCGFSGEIVSYIYDEIDTAARREFETHLANCTPCTDEFAEIANSRYSVFEWQKEEFAHLATPEIVIPYAPKPRAVGDEAPEGFFAGIAEMFGMRGIALAGAASLLVCLGLGFVAINYYGGSTQQIAANVNVPVAAPVNVNGVSVPEPVTTAKAVEPAKDLVKDQEIRPVRAVSEHKVTTNKQTTTATHRPLNNIPSQSTAAQLRKAPALSNFEDNDDKSLRLSDLFDEEVGSKL